MAGRKSMRTVLFIVLLLFLFFVLFTFNSIKLNSYVVAIAVVVVFSLILRSKKEIEIKN